MEGFADPIIGRLTKREVSPLNIENIRNVEDLTNEMNKARTERDDSRYDVLLSHSDDLFRGSGRVQETAFENIKSDIAEAEERAELERIRIEEELEQRRKMVLGSRKSFKEKTFQREETIEDFLTRDPEGVKDFLREWGLSKRATATTFKNRFRGISDESAELAESHLLGSLEE